jgi:hypothetical protein
VHSSPQDRLFARYVLVYQVDPVAFLRTAARFVRPGGVLAAGLPQPALFSETPIGGGVDAPHYAWLAGVTRTLLPRMVETGIVTAETLAIDTLESRLRSAVVEARSQVEGPAQVCAWSRI